MKLAVVGTRTFERAELVSAYLDRCRREQPDLVIVSGGARGADRLAAEYARRHHLDLVLFHADWQAHGRRAGALRNKQIVDAAEALVAFWDERSPGTKISLEMAVRKGIPATIVNAEGVEYVYPIIHVVK